MTLATPSHPPSKRATTHRPLRFSGLEHRALGSTRTALRDGTLEVSGLGETDRKGLEIELGAVQGFIPEIELPKAGARTSGRLVSRTRGRVDGQPDQVAGVLTFENEGDGVRIIPDFTCIGAPTYELQLFRAGTLVYRQAGMSGPAGTAASFAGGRRRVCCRVIVYSANFFTALSFTTPEGKQVLADSAFFVHENPKKRVDFLSAVTYTAQDLPHVLFHPGSVAIFDPFSTHRALGQAALRAVPGHLEVSGLGSDGDDGVRIDWEDARRWQAGFAAESVDRARGGSLHLTCLGSLGGRPEGPLATAHLAASHREVELRFDVSPLGAPSATLEVRRRGETVRLLPGSTDLTIRRAAAAATLGPTCSANLIGGSTTSPLAISIAGECVERGHQAGPLFGAS